MIEILIGSGIVVLGYFVCVIAGYISDKFYMQYTNPILLGDYFMLGFISLIHWGLFIAITYGLGFLILNNL